jgi:hypothetical protein
LVLVEKSVAEREGKLLKNATEATTGDSIRTYSPARLRKQKSHRKKKETKKLLYWQWCHMRVRVQIDHFTPEG